IAVRVFNHNGPPALWLSLNTGDATLRSDATWETSLADSTVRHATLASAPKTPGPGNSMAGGGRSLDSLITAWPVWILFLVIAAILIFFEIRLTRRSNAGQVGNGHSPLGWQKALVIV